ncbi:MAG: bifunctional 4-hydroxy-3-methylbut-2-enyl diphosphate reductase/30S ribosomal protein S1 [Ruminococcaceae bacterium]|nr:bifunctional 4-hydroxy-3-methylbut-2-enyl diphosphate reductase/30S ribosomal protein S1 [Oscillospiraceae bacterium]
MAEIILAKKAGFCFGVSRAIELIEKLIAEGKKVATLGPIIHNQQVIDELSEKGVKVVDDPADVPEGYVLVLRTHGVTRDVLSQVEQSGCEYIDAVCPFVKKIHKTVIENSSEDIVTIIAGDENHPEVKGIKSYAKGDSFVIDSAQKLEELIAEHPDLSTKPVIFVSQTTFSVKEWEKSLKNIKYLCTNSKIFDTICFATEERQREAAALSEVSDAMVVVGGRHSSNTRKLLAVCEKNCPSFLVETAQELYGINLEKYQKFGLTAGASTPAGIIKEVLETMSKIVNENQMIEEEKVLDSASVAEEFDFAAALEESLNSMNSDQKVVGTVLRITPTEIQVDIGRKQTGYIPYSEYSNDPTADPKADLNIGDTLNLIIMKTNDQEGFTMLSKKRYDAVAAWDTIVSAEGTDTILEGVVTEVVRGGVIVVSNNARLFIPASLATANRNDKLEDLVKKTVRFKVIEVNKQRRRAVGSIRAVLKSERKAAEEKFWAEAKEGEVRKGVVKSIMKFGAFVDIGGVDGMIHVSELSWNRIKDPSEVVSIGDEVEVTIKALDPEKKQIALGYKKLEDNPWEIFKSKYAVDSVAEVEIANFTEFGAFAHIVPGVDGLIHISQIANKHVAKPADVLKIGEKVEAKITEIDEERKRVSLSIRALLPVEEAAEEAAEEVVEEAAEEVVEEATEEAAE